MKNSDIDKFTEDIEIILFQKNKIDFINRIINDIVYQWKLPLSIISTASTGIKLKKELNLLEDKEIIPSMELINNSVQELSNSIDEFKYFINNTNNTMQTFSISELFEHIFKLLNIEFFSKNIEIRKNIQNIEIYSLKSKLSLVLINILNNSIDSILNQNISNKKIIFLKTYKKDNFLIIEIKNSIKILDNESIVALYNFNMTYEKLFRESKIDLYLSIKIIKKFLNGTILISNEKFIYKNKNYEGTNFLIKLKL
ncbi:MAG: hypothetical protein AB7S49_13505 [Arcobacter sp.]|uniref:hypothetical protein n=1 Tax=Arcobacter sp. TaxID=1872629 RepID=UPI003CFE6195